MPKPTLSGEGIFFSLSPGNLSKLVGDAWDSREFSKLAGWQRVCAGQMGVRSLLLPASSVSSLSGSRKDLMTGPLPALQTSLPLDSTHTLTSHTKPLQVSPALPHHTTNGPQSPADQSCTTVETRSALPMPTSLNHS